MHEGLLKIRQDTLTYTLSKIRALIDELTEQLASGEIHIARALEKSALAEEELASLENSLTTRLIAPCREYLAEMRQHWKTSWLERRKTYDPHNEAKHPFRDVHGKKLTLRIAAPQSVRSQSGCVYELSPLDASLGAPVHDRLSCVDFTEHDLHDVRESALIGQCMVIANAPIAQGTCLGVYTGTVVTSELFPYFTERTYSVSVPIVPGEHGASLSAANAFRSGTHLCIDGEGMLSRMNTIVSYDKRGIPRTQASTGYNVDVAWFEGNIGPYSVHIPVFFAAQNIASGEELRWNYEYGEEAIRANILKIAPTPPTLFPLLASLFERMFVLPVIFRRLL